MCLKRGLHLQARTKVTPRSMVPSVKILALKVNFSVSTEVRMLASFLRCFPNIETLHVEVKLRALNLSIQHPHRINHCPVIALSIDFVVCYR